MNYKIGYIFYDDNDYINVAEWCNDNGCKIDLYEKDGQGVQRYIISENPMPIPKPIVATWQDKIEAQVMYTALMTDSLIEEGEE